jgi:S-DNA-T family DNA segregation ATPase FtsK/SpoIIIE
MRTLRVTSGPAAGATLEVERQIVIGRENADLTIRDPELSRRHALVRPIERGLAIQDLDSLNGTFVNGERIDGEVLLTTSAWVRVGTSRIEVELAVGT